MVSPYDTVPGKIFIGGISSMTTQNTLQKYFEQFGELSDCIIMQDKTTGKSRGFGFVTFRDSNVLENVLKLRHLLDGKELDCKKAIRREQLQNEVVKEESPVQTKKLFVGGLLQTTTEDELRAYFEQFGIIEDLIIMIDKMTGKSRGFGFVTFRSEDSVKSVIQQYYENKIGGKWVECKKAQPKNASLPSSRKGSLKQGIRDQSRQHQNFDEVKDYEQEFYQGPVDLNSDPQRYPRNPSLQSNFEGHSFPTGFKQTLENNYDQGFNVPINTTYNVGTHFNGYPPNTQLQNPNTNYPNNYYNGPGYGSQFQSNFQNQYPDPHQRQGFSGGHFSMNKKHNSQRYGGMPMKNNHIVQTSLIKPNLSANIIPTMSNAPVNQEGFPSPLQNTSRINENYSGNLGFVNGFSENLGPSPITENIYPTGDNHLVQNGNILETRHPGIQQNIMVPSTTPFNFSVFPADLNASR